MEKAKNGEQKLMTLECWKDLPYRKCLGLPLVLFSLWTAGLVFSARWIWTNAIPFSPAKPMHTFLLVSALSGAFGGLVLGIKRFKQFMLVACQVRHGQEHPTWNPLSYLLVVPLLWPIPGAAFGVLMAALFLDEGTSLLKVVLLGLAGGLIWRTILKKVPQLFLGGDTEGD